MSWLLVRCASIPRFSTSSVIAIEKTPSLKATIRENSVSLSSRRFAVCSLVIAAIAASSRPGATEPVDSRAAAR